MLLVGTQVLKVMENSLKCQKAHSCDYQRFPKTYFGIVIWKESLLKSFSKRLCKERDWTMSKYYKIYSPSSDFAPEFNSNILVVSLTSKTIFGAPLTKCWI